MPSTPPPFAPPPASQGDPLRIFQERAALALAGRKMVDAQTWLLLCAIADEVGLPRDDVQPAVRDLVLENAAAAPPPPPAIAGAAPPPFAPSSSAPPVAAGPASSSSSAIEMISPGAAAAPPAAHDSGALPSRSAPSPADKFREYVRTALADIESGRLNPRREAKLIEQGVAKLGLSEVFARHIVTEAAIEAGLRVVSQEQVAAARAAALSHPQVQSFLSSAGPIIARDRGINPRSLVKLQALADELGLSSEQRTLALGILQGDGASGDEAMSSAAREQAYREFAREQLSKLSHGILNTAQAQKLEEAAERLHGLDRQQAKPIIRQAAAEQGLRVISEEQAQRHIEATAASLLGGAPRSDSATRERLLHEGRQWGLSDEQSEAILREASQANRRAGQAKRRRTSALAAAGAVSVILLLCLVAWHALSRPLPSPEPSDLAQTPPAAPAREGAPDEAAPGNEARTAAAPRDKPWGDVELSVSVLNARSLLPDLYETLDRIRSPDVNQRIASYRTLVERQGRQSDNLRLVGAIRDVLSGCHALDPEEQAAAALRETLIEQSAPLAGNLPDRAGPYQQGFAALRTLVSFWERKGLSDDRRRALARALEKASGAAVDMGLSGRDVRERCMGEVCRRLYKTLAAAADSQPVLVSSLLDVVQREALRELETRTVETLNVEFFVAALPKLGQHWLLFQDPLGRAVLAADPANVLRMVELFETLPESDALDYMGGGLLTRAGRPIRPMTVDEVAHAVRESLGADAVKAASGQGRRRALGERVKAALDGLKGAGASPHELLGQIVELAHAQTLACAFAQRELGESTFAELNRAGPATIEASAAAIPIRRAAAPNFAMRREVDRLTKGLRNARTVPTRLQTLRSIADRTPELDDVDYRVAIPLARAVADRWPDAVLDEALPVFAALGRWRQFRLALADAIDPAETEGAFRARPEHAVRIVSQVTGRELTIADDEDVRARLRDELFRSILNESSAGAAGGRQEEAAAEALREYYTSQARLLGAPAGDLQAVRLPGEAMRLLVTAQRARAQGLALRPEDAAWLKDLDSRLQAAEHLAGSDVDLAALMGRVYARLVAMEAAAKKPLRAGEADAALAELSAAEAKASSALEQLRSVQEAALRLWMILADDESQMS